MASVSRLQPALTRAYVRSYLVADQYPAAEVIGLDLSPIQTPWVPPNLRFIVDDIEDEWVSGDDFDLVHLRHMSPVLKNVRPVVAKALA